MAKPHAGARPKRPVRDNLESLGIAILFAVLLKPLLIEAYVIPTSSMQPTMMGSKEAGVFDRLLVDKLRYALTPPERWDISVFRYPIRESQNYVKRIVGMPGDLLRIVGGNIYVGDGDARRIERKPERLQERLWKEIYPLRRLIVGSSKILGEDSYFVGSGGDWRQEGDDLAVVASGSRLVRLSYTNGGEGGLSNQIYDGYPVSVAAAIKRDEAARGGRYAVQDARCSFVLTPQSEPEELRVRLERSDPGAAAGLRFTLEIGKGKARLEVAREGSVLQTSEPFAFALPAGRATAVSFAHIDDRLIVARDGARLAELDCPLAPLADELPAGAVALRIEARGGERLLFAGLRIERDLHYTTTGLTEQEQREGVAVPDGHYMMLGDNTLASADARQWRVFTVGVLPDGRMVDPRRHPDARVLRGNVRPVDLAKPPDADENPVIVRGRDRVVFTDELGEYFALRSAVSNAYGDPPSGGDFQMLFRELDASGRPTDHEWSPEIGPVHFVPRDDLLGRPVLGFFPFWPLGPNRVGFIR
jgi:signal peptidase I